MTKLDIITAPNITTTHGFLGRQGGISDGHYEGLNLGLSSGDTEEKVAENRKIVLEHFQKTQEQTCAFHQIHSDKILSADASWFEHQADASITDDPNLFLVVSVADCMPVLFHDPIKKVVGAAHCGWRGTVQGIAAKTIQKMQDDYGCAVGDIQVAMGMGIRQESYQVGEEVIAEFREAGYSQADVASVDESSKGKFRLDVAAANRIQLLDKGIQADNLWDSGLDTFTDSDRFYSHRRDKGLTGRHWAVIHL